MAYPLPPWLNPVNPVPSFEHGVSTGASIAEAQNRTELAIQEMTLRREAQQRAQEAQNLAAQRTMQDMVIAQQHAQEQAKQAAMKWQWNQEIQDRISKGEDPMKAWEATAPRYNPQGFATYARDKQHQAAIEQRMKESAAARQQLDQDRQNLGRERFEWEKEKYYTTPQTKEPTLTELMKAHQALPDGDPAKKALQSQIDKRLGVEGVMSGDVKKLVDEYAELQGKLKSGDLYFGPDFLKLGTSRADKAKQIENELRKAGWNVTGERMGNAPVEQPTPAQVQAEARQAMEALGPMPAARTNAPVTAPAKPSGKVRIRRKSDGKEFWYSGSAEEVPSDKYEVL